MATTLLLLTLLAASPTTAAQHRLLASSFATNHLHALTYDDATNALTLSRRILTPRAGHAALALNRARTTLYATQRGGWASYALGATPLAPWELRVTGAVKLNDSCLGLEAKRGSTEVAVGPVAPFAVYGVGKSPCGAVLATVGGGAIAAAVQPLEFGAGSRVRGMVVHPRGGALFAADAGVNGVWVRPLDGRGRVVGAGRVVRVPVENAGVSGVLVHPAGRYLYVLLRKRVQVVVFEIVGEGSRMDLRYTNTTISLLPGSVAPKPYKGAAMQLSADGRILFGTVKHPPQQADEDSDDDGPRASPRALPAAAPYGFLTAALLSGGPPADPALTGFPLQLLLQVQTTTSGGQSHAAAPAPWSRAHVALADSERARVQVWRIDGLENGALPTGRGGAGGAWDVLSQEALGRVRANIVAEWQAPAEDVGRGETDRRAGARQFGMGAARAGEAEEGADVPVGRGCCADLVWLD